MDRRTWLQLLSILSAARAGYSQERPAGGGRDPQQQALAVTKEQVVAALQLMGLPAG